METVRRKRGDGEGLAGGGELLVEGAQLDEVLVRQPAVRRRVHHEDNLASARGGGEWDELKD